MKKCIIESGIEGTPGTALTLAEWLANYRTDFILSRGDLCQPAFFEGRISRSTAYLMAHRALNCSPGIKGDMLEEYPYYSLLYTALTEDKDEMINKLSNCNYQGLFQDLLYTAGFEFLSAINSSSSSTITNAYNTFVLVYANPGSLGSIDYLLNIVPPAELAAWFESNSYDYDADAATLDVNTLVKVLRGRYPECELKSCLKPDWLSNTVTIDFNELLPWYKENYWAGILDTVYDCAADSFTYYVSYNQRSVIADLLDNWHLPMKDFMSEIQTHYGTGIKNWLNLDTLRHYQYAKLNELHIYGSSRLGTLNVSDTVYGGIRLYNFDLSSGDTSMTYEMVYEDFYTLDSAYKLHRGDKSYEGSNHLGNVLVVFSDKRIPLCSDGTVYKYQADLKQAQHYSAFGAPMPDLRWYASSISQYKFGFNSQEQDDEIYGDGNTNTAAFWEYDARLGRRWNRDPVKKVAISEYASFNNTPTLFKDPFGLDVTNGDDIRAVHYKKKTELSGNGIGSIESQIGTRKADFKRVLGENWSNLWEGFNERKRNHEYDVSLLKEYSTKAILTRSIIKRWKIESPNLFEQVNSATNAQGESVDFVLTVEDNTGAGNYGSNTPGFLGAGDNVRPMSKEFGKNTVLIKINPNVNLDKPDPNTGNSKNGYALNHEAGHFLYFVKYTKAYYDYWISVNGETGNGHLPGDNSGKAADQIGSFKDWSGEILEDGTIK